jgi:DNA-directed RNA polymerase specialized sigma subunit
VTSTVSDLLACQDSDPRDTIAHRALHRALMTIRLPVRRVMLLRYGWDELTLSEVGRRLGLSQGQVRTLEMEGIVKMRAELRRMRSLLELQLDGDRITARPHLRLVGAGER